MKKVIFILIILSFFTACKTKTVLVPVEHTKIETRDILRIDSIYNRDTLYVYTKKDTVYFQSIKWREKYSLDTINITKIDSIPYPVEIEKIVEVNKLTWWQETRLKILNIVLVLGGIGILVYILIKRI